MRMKQTVFAGALLAAGILPPATSAHAQQEVKVGVIYPLSGPVAQVGIDAVAAVKTVLEIVNDGADLPLPLAKSKGLPGLGGAKVTIVVSDHQGKPEVGLSEAERLISQEKVHALFGAYFSSVTGAASQAAEQSAGRAGQPGRQARGDGFGLGIHQQWRRRAALDGAAEGGQQAGLRHIAQDQRLGVSLEPGTPGASSRPA